MSLHIISVYDHEPVRVIAFSVNNDLFFLKLGSNYPQIFDGELHKQNVANVDEWVQQRTHLRYSFRSVCDMADAFLDGSRSAFSRDELASVLVAAVQKTRECIFLTDRASDYSRLFWIETSDPSHLERSFEKIRDKFDVLRESLGDDKLYNYLCRMYAICAKQKSGMAPVCEGMIRRLGRVLDAPQYPQPTTIDEQLVKDVFIKLWPHGHVPYKNDVGDIIGKMKQLI